MGGSVIFYTYGSTLELNGQQLTAGMLTADLLNLSPDEYMRLKKRMTQITDLAKEYERKWDVALWWKLNEKMDVLCQKLRRYQVFRLLLDFVYVEFMKGLQKGFVPKRCANCGRWFLQMPGMTYAYCGEPAPGQDGKTCREIGATSSFRSKVQNNDVWKAHQRAYKKYFARTRKGTMSKGVFEVWSQKMETLRDDALMEYGRAQSEEERQRIVDEVTQKLNKL